MQTQIKRLKSRKGETYVDTGIKILSAVVCGALVLGSIFWILKSTVLSNVNNAVADLFNAPEKNPLEAVMWEPGVEKVSSTGALWTMDGNTLTGYKGTLTAGMSLVIPNEVDGVRVIRVQNDQTVATDTEKRFNIFGTTSNSTVASITISEGIKEIGDCAFINCTGLTGDLVIPNTIRLLGYKSFEGCSGFKGNLVLPDSLTTIDGCAFQACSGFTGDLILPDSVKTIGLGAFNKCSSMTGKLVLPPTLQEISKGVFQYCGFTGQLILPETVTSIGEYAFNQCKGFTGPLTLPQGLTNIGRAAFQGDAGFTGPLNIPNGVKEISPFAFNACSGLTALTLPEGLETIGGAAFQSCGFSNNLVIPDSVTTMESYAFNHCSNFSNTELVFPSSLTTFGESHMFYNCATSSLATISIDENNPNFKVVDDVLYSKDGTKLLFYPPKKADVSYTLPEGITFINELSFSRNKLLQTLTIPNSYVIQTSNFSEDFLNTYWGNGLAIGIYIFTSIENITVKADNPRYASVNGALYSKDLKSLWYMPVCRTGAIVIPDGTERLEYGCLYPKYATSVYIPESVTFIDNTVITSLNDLSATVTISPDNPGYRVENGIIIEK